MTVTIGDVELAYRKLKSLIYYDKTDLRLRARLAAFECDKSFEKKLSTVRKVANAAKPHTEQQFRKWLDAIRFRLVPKKLEEDKSDKKEDKSDKKIDDAGSGRFITNVTTAPVIGIEKVNYFFDGPIELHLIAVLWIIKEGCVLDTSLRPECCGSRLSTKVGTKDDKSVELFAKYHEQYARWRDNGIRKAKQLLVEEGQNVAILGLDVQEYFYRINIEFSEIRDELRKLGNSSSASAGGQHKLLKCVETIGNAYRKSITTSLRITHKDIAEDTVGLPIGLCSSLVLANWYLQKFDDEVIHQIRPAYYGRYVDDILLVVTQPNAPTKRDNDPVESFIQDVLVRNKILSKPNKGAYSLLARPGLRLQQSKCILQYFDARHSIAGLEKFKKKLEKNGSDFLLLPVDEADNSMEEVAYELLYEGSVNKFRSVKGVAENRYELAKHLARQAILHLLTDDPPDKKISRGLQKFFKGRSAIEFFDLWERVLTLLVVSDDKITASAFKKQVEKEISRIKAESNSITRQLVTDLNQHLALSMAMANSVCAEDVGISELSEGFEYETLRRANMLRHHFVRRPLLNFTTFSGALNVRTIESAVKFDNRRAKYSPRFVNFDECMLLAQGGDIHPERDSVFELAKKIFKAINHINLVGIDWSSEKNKKR